MIIFNLGHDILRQIQILLSPLFLMTPSKNVVSYDSAQYTELYMYLHMSYV